jgi:hypothetical protein
VIAQHSERFVPPSGTNLELVRRWFYENSTIGELYFEGVFQCFILEPRKRADGVKIAGVTCIPPGRYEIRLTHSPAFNRTLPVLCDVKDYQGVRFHEGNTFKDTKACLITGTAWSRKGDEEPRVDHSVVALTALQKKLEFSAGPRWLTVREDIAVDQRRTA